MNKRYHFDDLPGRYEQSDEEKVSAAGFHWKKKGDSIVLDGWNGLGSVVEIPGHINGINVAEVEGYVFSDKEMLNEVGIPGEIRSIGDHAFYGSRHLRHLTLTDHVHRIGDGAFKNCDDLRYIDLTSDAGRDACIRDILSDCPQEIQVNLHYPDGEAVLIFPEYEIEYFENYPARLFYHETYGTGEAYRQCLQEMQINWQDYDALFERSGREDRPQVTAAIAMYRLRYPRRLSSAKEKSYREWLKIHAADAVRWILEEDQAEKLQVLGDLQVLTEENLSSCVDAAEEFGNPAAVSLLLEWKMKKAGTASGRGRSRYSF